MRSIQCFRFSNIFSLKCYLFNHHFVILTDWSIHEACVLFVRFFTEKELLRRGRFIKEYMMYKMNLLARCNSKIAFLCTRQATKRAIHSFAPSVFMPQVNKTTNGFYTTLCSSVQTAQLRGKVLTEPKCFASQLNQDLRGLPASYVRELELTKQILSRDTVQGQLEFYEIWKDNASLTSRITILHNMAKIVQKHRDQADVWQKEKEKVLRGEESAYTEILDFIADNILLCKTQGLANVMWSLGKLKEHDHRLVEVCLKEILFHDVAFFYKAEVLQILNGLTELKVKDSPVFRRVEKAILDGRIKIARCEKQQIAGILTSFVKMGRGSEDFYKTFEAEIVDRGFRVFHNGEITQILRTFAIVGISSDSLFNKAEEEILRRSPFKLRRTELVVILRAFAMAGKGSKELFAEFDEEIVTRRVKDYYSLPLCWIIWAFATRRMANCGVYRAAAQEIYMRGFNNLENGELALCLYSYVLSEVPCGAFLKALETELMSRDLETFGSIQLCQVLWACVKAGLLNPKLLQDLEDKILHQIASQNEGKVTVELFLGAETGSQEQLHYLQEMCALTT